MKENVAIKKAHDKLEEMSNDEAMEHLIDMEESYKYLLNTERNMGIKQGIEQRKKERKKGDCKENERKRNRHYFYYRNHRSFRRRD